MIKSIKQSQTISLAPVVNMFPQSAPIKTKLGFFYFLTLSIIIVLILITQYISLNVDPQEYFNYLKKTNSDLLNKKMTNLINANTLENLPNISLVTDNSEIKDLQKCKQGATFMGPLMEENSYLKQCKKKCGGNGIVINIDNETEYYSNGIKLTEGSWCIIESVPCNSKTGYVVATVNSTLCKSKYPNMFGGPSATTVIACNNENYPATGSILWDNMRNEPVNPLTINMSHEAETLSDGSYRFTCKYNDDINGNNYIPHPLNRFHPIRDPCKKTIYKASVDVKVILTSTDWFCDCGTFSKTRVTNIDKANSKSTCTSCLNKSDPSTDTVTVPFNCFTLNSSYKDASEMFPCTSSKFTEHGNLCSTLDLHIKELMDTSPITPGVKDMPFSGITLPDTDFRFKIKNLS